MIKAVIFDCFGVLTADAWLPFKNQHFANEPEKYDEATRLNALANSGTIPYSQFLTMVAQMAGVSAQELDKVMHTSVENEAVFAYIKELKQHYKIGMLSNISGDWLHELFDEHTIQLFDAIALSYQTGFAKPDEGAYQAVIKMLGVLPEDCIFIDDQERFVEAGRAVGMHGVVFHDVPHLKENITKLLV